jgi:hypothetical protein
MISVDAQCGGVHASLDVYMFSCGRCLQPGSALFSTAQTVRIRDVTVYSSVQFILCE